MKVKKTQEEKKVTNTIQPRVAPYFLRSCAAVVLRFKTKTERKRDRYIYIYTYIYIYICVQVYIYIYISKTTTPQHKKIKTCTECSSKS